jgi:hypothetical protein
MNSAFQTSNASPGGPAGPSSDWPDFHERTLKFPIFARGGSVYDTMNRQKVAECDGLRFSPRVSAIADRDRIVVITRKVEEEIISRPCAPGKDCSKDALGKLAKDRRDRTLQRPIESLQTVHSENAV